MLSGIAQIKALKELKGIVDSKAGLSGLALIKALKRQNELRLDLGMGQAGEAKPGHPDNTATPASDAMARVLTEKYPAFADQYQSDKNMQQAARYVNAIKAVNSNSNIADIYNLASNIAYQDSYITAVYEFTDFKHNSSGFKPNENNQDIHDYADNYMPAIEKAVNKHIADKMGISYDDLMLSIEKQKQINIEKRRQEKLDKDAEAKAAANFFKYHFPRAFADKKDDYKAKAKSYLSETVRYAPLDGDAYLIGGIMPRYEYIHRMLASGATFVKSGKTGDFHMTDSPIKYGIGQYEVAYIEYLTSNAVAIRAKPFLMADGTPIEPKKQSEPSDANTTTPTSATHKITMGRTNKVKTAKGTKIDTQFALVDGKYLIASHTATGAENPKYPQDLQPRDRKRESSIAWVQKTAKDLDPESLGRTGRADTGAPIVGEDLIVESGNGRSMAIMLAYKEGTADEYRQWLIENADLFGFTEQQVESYKQPVLVRIRKTPVDRATFAVEANQDDKLSFTATERAKSDAKRIDDRLIQLFSPSDDGDLLAASNREFIRGFMASLGDTEAAQYTDSNGKPTQALLTRIKAAIFSKAYDDDRLLEMMADHSKPELQNMLNALSMAAPKFVEARGVSLGDTQELAEKLVDGVEASIDDQVKNAIIDATNMIITAKRNNQSITEFVTQQGLFEDVDEATAQLAVFIATHARSAKKMAEYFKAMAQAIEDEKVKGQTLDMFGEPEPLDLKTILDFANSVVNPDTPATLDNPSPSTDYSPDNPFAPYANDDPEVKQNADDWESRKPLTEQRLADMNALAESMGYVTYIESRHANMGVFQAEKKAGNRHVSIDGRFINNDADSVKETARDFTLEMQENGEPEDYFYTNDLQAALTKGNEWLENSNDEPVIKLTGEEFGYNEGLTIGELREKAISSLAEIRDQWIDVPALSVFEKEPKIQMRQRGIDHMESFSPNHEKLLLIAHIKDVLKTSQFLYKEKNKKTDKKPDVELYYYLHNTFIYDKKPLHCVVVVEKDQTGLLHYDVVLGKYADKHLQMAKELMQKNMLDNSTLEKSLGNYQAQDNNIQVDNISQTMFDKTTSNTADMVLNLFIFDENGNELDINQDNFDFHPSPLQAILDSLNNSADPLSIDLESLGRLAEDEPDSPLLDQIDQQLGKALRTAGVALADKVA